MRIVHRVVGEDGKIETVSEEEFHPTQHGIDFALQSDGVLKIRLYKLNKPKDVIVTLSALETEQFFDFLKEWKKKLEGLAK